MIRVALVSVVLAIAMSALLPLPVSGSARERLDRPGAVVLDVRTGRVLARVAADDAITSAVRDGRGGWYVGGSFTRVDGHARRALARLRANGSFDRDWRVSIASRRGNPVSVTALARFRGRLYVGGAFGLVGGLRRAGLAAVEVRARAALRSFRPGTFIDVQRLAVTRERLLVARNHSYPVPGITALDLGTGASDPRWNPGFKLIGGAGAFNAVVVRERQVFVAGSFRLKGLRRNGLVALDARTGTPDRLWAPQPPDCPVCNGFAVLTDVAIGDDRVYVSGSFTRFAGVRRNGVVALDRRTGAVDRRWSPARGSHEALTLALAGRRLYLGTMNGLVVIDRRTGRALRVPNLPFKSVFLLARSGPRLLVAGR